MWPLGLIFRNSAVRVSPVPQCVGTFLYSSPSSSSAHNDRNARDTGTPYSVIIAASSHCDAPSYTNRAAAGKRRGTGGGRVRQYSCACSRRIRFAREPYPPSPSSNARARRCSMTSLSMSKNAGSRPRENDAGLGPPKSSSSVGVCGGAPNGARCVTVLEVATVSVLTLAAGVSLTCDRCLFGLFLIGRVFGLDRFFGRGIVSSP